MIDDLRKELAEAERKYDGTKSRVVELAWARRW